MPEVWNGAMRSEVLRVRPTQSAIACFVMARTPL